MYNSPGAIARWSNNATLLCPSQDGAVAELRVGGVLFHKSIEPVEWAFLWQGNLHTLYVNTYSAVTKVCPDSTEVNVTPFPP